MSRSTQKKMFSFYKSGKEKTCLDITEYTQIRDCKTDPRDERFYLVGEAVEKLAAYEDAEEQGLLLKLPCKVGDVVDKLFSHNEIISLWVEVKEEIIFKRLIWNGMAWNIPENLKQCNFEKIFGTIPQQITQADVINIVITSSKEVEEALAKIQEENENE